jgi:GMP synthase-like glutamine amidotransferase
MHRDAVLEYPPGTVALARTEQCPTQAIYIPRRLITVQGHPEFCDFMMRELLQARHYGGTIADGPFEDAMTRAADKHDGVAIARAFLRFLWE